MLHIALQRDVRVVAPTPMPITLPSLGLAGTVRIAGSGLGLACLAGLPLQVFPLQREFGVIVGVMRGRRQRFELFEVHLQFLFDVVGDLVEGLGFLVVHLDQGVLLRAGDAEL